MSNPAKRLLNLLKEGKSDEVNRQASCIQVWRRLLDVPDGDDSQLLSRLGKTIALAGEIEDELKQTGIEDYKSNLAWVPLLRNAFAGQNLTSPWSGFIDKVDDHTLNYLSNCSNILDIRFPAKYNSIGSVVDLAAEINDLLGEVISSDLREDVKSYMSQKLREMQRALDEYEITGNGPVIKAIESYVGHVVINRHAVLSVKDHPVVQRFGRLMTRLAVLTTLVMGGLQLPGEIDDLFPSESIAPMQNKLRDSSGVNDGAEEETEIA